MLRCSPREFMEWKAFFRVDPWDQDRADLRSGILASLICNMFAGKGATRAKPDDFLLSEKRPPQPMRRQSSAEVAAVLEGIIAAQQGRPE